MSEEGRVPVDEPHTPSSRWQGVFTANEAPPAEPIPFHHEMAQCDDKPNYM